MLSRSSDDADASWGAWPFVGRTAEVDAVVGAVLGRPSGLGLLLTGQLGVGKSGLLRQVAAVLESRGRFVVDAFAAESIADRPLWAFWHIDGIRRGETIDGHLRWRVMLDALSLDAAGRKIVFVIDNIHFLDHLSAAFVYYAVLQAKVTLVAAAPTGAVLPPAVEALWRESRLAQVVVRPLDFQSTVSLLAGVFGDPFETRSARRVWRLTQGNPLMLREIIESLRSQAGSVELVDEMWRLGRSDSVFAVTATQRIEGRIRSLSDEVREVAELVALAEPIGLTALIGLTSIESVERTEIERLIEARSSRSRVQMHMIHPLYGELLRQQLPASRRRRHLGALTRQVLGFGARRAEDALLLGMWFLQGSDLDDVHLLAAAARLALGRLDFPLAAPLARAAVARGAGFDAVEVLATASGLTGEPVDALALLEQIEASLTDERQRVRWLIAKSVIEFGFLHDVTTPGRLAEAASRLTCPDADNALVLAACLDVGCGRWEELQTLQQLQETSEFPAARTAAAAMTTAVGALRGGGENLALTFVDLEQQTLEYSARWPAMRVTIEFARWAIGLVTARTQWLGDEDDNESTRFFPIVDAQTRLAKAIGLRYRGQLDAAWSAAAEARALTRHGGPMFLCAAAAESAQINAALGRIEDARDAVAECDQAFGPTTALYYPVIELARVTVACAGEDLGTAAAAARQLATRLHQDGFAGIEIHALHQLARIAHLTTTDVRRLHALAGTVPGPFPQAVAQHAAALMAQSSQQLHRAVQQYEELGLNLFAAEATAQLLGIQQRQREPGAGTTAGHLANLLTAGQRWHTPALCDLLPDLTPREWQVFKLAAQGRSNAQISRELTVAQRTSESHLRRISKRLGVTNRNELPGFAELYEVLLQWALRSRTTEIA